MTAKRGSFSQIRKREFDTRLEEAGFIKGKMMWTRSRGEQLHAIWLQVLGSRAQYAASVCFNYAFIPSHHTFLPVDSLQADPVDFALYTRLPNRPGQPTWFKDTDAPGERLAVELAEEAISAVAFLDEHQRLWADPHWFLNDFTIEAFDQETPVTNPCPGSTGVPKIWSFIPGWYPRKSNMAYMMSHIALWSGNRALAKEYAEYAQAQIYPKDSYQVPFIKALIESLSD